MTALSGLPPELAKEIVCAFAEHVPKCWGALDDSQTMVGFEWNWQNGAKFWLDIEEDGNVTFYWRPAEAKTGG